METSYTEPINPNRTRVGWIGIGIMGTSMASRVLLAGYAITVNAKAPEKALCLQNRDAHLANSPADVARVSDVVFTMVGHPSDIRSVVLGDEGILSNLPNGGVIVDTTGSHPLLAREIATAARMRGCWAVDAPVSMVMELFGERMIERERERDFKPGGFAEYIVKDLGMDLDGEAEEGMLLPGAALLKQLFLGMVANGDGKMGIHGVVTVIERINGK